MIILGIETSCDDTSVAIVRDGREVLSNATHSQILDHSQYGGVIPELASRKHLEFFTLVLDKALQDAELSLQQIDAIAVTIGPGLLGSLLIGVNAGKTLSYVLDKPCIPVDHLLGHLYAPWLRKTKFQLPITKNENKNSQQDVLTFDGSNTPEFPIVSLTVSGGHSSVVLQQSHTDRTLLGQTLDDAAGEAFDKVAVLLGLGYPGGPLIDNLSKNGSPTAIHFPRAMQDHEGYDYSFSGLKSAVVRQVTSGEILSKEDIAASFQEAVVDSLLFKLQKAYLHYKPATVVITGGVSANSRLREKARDIFGDILLFPDFSFCTDNAAMIAGAGFYQYTHNKTVDYAYDVCEVSLESTLG
jgi:N6-L-threonylcarbamoyladenine synthase